jgi:hypothetical protein
MVHFCDQLGRFSPQNMVCEQNHNTVGVQSTCVFSKDGVY